MAEVRPFQWRNGELILIDQTVLPLQERYVVCHTAEEVAEAIRTMKVRGAPAIGCVAAIGMVLAVQRARPETKAELLEVLHRARAVLATSRPTAVNLFWALERIIRVAQATDGTAQEVIMRIQAEARAIVDEDIVANRRMGEYGAKLVPSRANILTHCNAGALATAGYGTALGVIRAAHAQGKNVHVWVDETRPFLQGARLTAWELKQEGIPFTLISDSVAGSLMSAGKVDLVIVGADRIAANGDVANKIGTYSLAVLCHHHNIPFYVAAPTSTIDLACPSGEHIPIEERDPEEVRCVLNARIALEDTPVFNPAFDVTPHHLVKAIVTENGIAEPPFFETIPKLVSH